MNKKIILAVRLEGHLTLKPMKIFAAGLLILLFIFSSSAVERNNEPVKSYSFLYDVLSFYSKTPLFENFGGKKIQDYQARLPCQFNYDPDFNNQPTGVRNMPAQGGEGVFIVFERSAFPNCPKPSVVFISGEPLFTVTNIKPVAPNSDLVYRVYYTLSPNLTGETRDNTFTIISGSVIGESVDAWQSPGCAFSLNLSSGATIFSPEGGQEELNFQSSPNCPATILTSDVSWMRVVGTTLVVDPQPPSVAKTTKPEAASFLPPTGRRCGTISIQGAGNAQTPLKICEGTVRKPVIIPSKDKFRIRTRTAVIGVRG